MLSLALISAAAALLQTAPGAERPPRLTDEQLISVLLAERPTARIVSQSPRNGGGGSRHICGLMDIDGAIEPFSVFTSWEEAEAARVIIAGFPPTEAKPAQWRTFANGPRAADWDADGDLDVTDRNMNANYRKMALIYCHDTNPITPPEGVNWVLTSEPDPARRRGPPPGYPVLPPLPLPPIPPAEVSGPARPLR